MTISTNIISRPLLGAVVVLSTMNLVFLCEAFHPVVLSSSKSFGNGIIWAPKRVSLKLSLQKGWFEDDKEDDDSLVTREDLHRDMLGMEPKVKRKKRKGKGYEPLDNRDHLPFSVRTKSPDDPYKNRFQKQKEQQLKKNSKRIRGKATDLDHHMLASTKRGPGTNKIKGKKDMKGKSHDSNSSTAPSRLIQRRSKKNDNGQDDKSMTTVLGEFELDKSTTSGDVVVLGNKEYRVESARCQYKYAGGQRFVMVDRKSVV